MIHKVDDEKPHSSLYIDIPNVYTVRENDKDTKSLSSWKAVDFIIETTDKIMFIEFKDPDNPLIPPQYRSGESFIEDFLFDELSEKTRHCFLYEYAMDRVRKPVFFYVVIGMQSIDAGLALALQDKLKKRIPIEGPKGFSWKRRFIEDCFIFNIASWNKYFPDLPVSRISSGTA